MMRVCPKCGDYYADAYLAFCLTEGTPLINLNQRSQSWAEGTRVIEEKKNAARKQTRRLKWRRVLVGLTTMMVATMVLRFGFETVVSPMPVPKQSSAVGLTPTPA